MITASSHASTGTERTPAPPPRLCVLVVDDELLIRWSITQTLVAAGHRVFEAADAASTRYLLQRLEAPPDVVLLDYRLPDNDGLSLLADVRRLSPTSAVVMMTAYGTPDVTRAARELGADVLLQKPFDVRIVEEALRHAAARKATAVS